MNEQRKPLLHHLHDYFLPHERNNHRPHIFSAMSVAVLIFGIIIFELGYVVQTKVVFLNTNFLASVLPGVLASLTNESRTANGITSVARDAELDAVAQTVAEDMAAKGYFAHVSPDGKTPWYWLNQAGYSYSYAGENLAVNFTDSQNVQTAWLESPTHRANIMKQEYTRVGFGTANGLYEGKETTFVVEFFATPGVTPTEKVVPVLAVAEPALTTPVTTSSTSAQVLGTETKMSPEVAPEKSALAASAVPAPVGWFASFLVSPFTMLMTALYVLFVIIALAFIVAVFVRGKNQHPSVLVGGTLLLVLISGAMFASSVLGGGVQLSAQGGASVENALSI